MEVTGSSRKDQDEAGVVGTEGGRRPTGVPTTPAAASPGGPLPGGPPDPEVPEKPTRRKFPAEYKRRILQEADRCTEPGQLGELVRREALYSSHLITWRKQRERGVLSGLAPLPLRVERVELFFQPLLGALAGIHATAAAACRSSSRSCKMLGEVVSGSCGVAA